MQDSLHAQWTLCSDREKTETSSWGICFITCFTSVSTYSKMCFHDTDKIELSGYMVQFKGYQNPNKSNIFLFPSTIWFQSRDASKKISTQNRINSSSYRAVPLLFITALWELFSAIATLEVSQLIRVCGAVRPVSRCQTPCCSRTSSAQSVAYTATGRAIKT